MPAWDVVIVGAGSAGCVLANRLSADPARRVLLVEAGGAGGTLATRIPAAFKTLFHGPLDWALETEPEPAMNGRRMFWPRGRMLGGSSAMNAMLWVRGQRQDYDGWAELGNAGWGWDDVLPCFRRAEDHHAANGAHLGRGGPMRVERQRDPSPLTRAWLAAAQSRGLAVLEDLNAQTAEGVGLLDVTQRRGERESTATAYLRPVRHRPNLTIRTGVTVERVSFEGRRAVGVTLKTGTNSVEAVRAGLVILSAGAVHSPQVLLRSGLGPGAPLQALGIPLVADLPGVGLNLQDHVVAGIGIRCTAPVSLASAETPWRLAQWLLTRRGPLTSTVAEGAGFIRSGPDAATPDLELIFAPTFFVDHGTANPPGHGYTLGVVLLRPRSRGRVELRSADPGEPPRIIANYLADPDDLGRLVRGLTVCREIAAASALARWRGPEEIPGSGVSGSEGLADHVRATAQTLYHPVGTCAMGTGPDAVVDSSLRVHGVEGLRVVDASVMPRIISGHTNAATIMIGERAAEMIAAE